MAKATDSVLPQLADALHKKGYYNEALLRFRQALASDESDAELWFGLAQTRLALDQKSEAVAGLNRALNSGLAQPARALKLLASIGAESLFAARAALERNPHDIALLALTAEFEIAHGNGAEARAMAQRLSELAPERVALVTPVIEKLIEHGWLDEARTLLERFARDIPEDPEIELLVGLLAAKVNDGS